MASLSLWCYRVSESQGCIPWPTCPCGIVEYQNAQGISLGLQYFSGVIEYQNPQGVFLGLHVPMVLWSITSVYPVASMSLWWYSIRIPRVYSLFHVPMVLWSMRNLRVYPLTPMWCCVSLSLWCYGVSESLVRSPGPSVVLCVHYQ